MIVQKIGSRGFLDQHSTKAIVVGCVVLHVFTSKTQRSFSLTSLSLPNMCKRENLFLWRVRIIEMSVTTMV